MPGYDAIDLSQDEQSATVTLRPADGGPDLQITGRYVIPSIRTLKCRRDPTAALQPAPTSPFTSQRGAAHRPTSVCIQPSKSRAIRRDRKATTTTCSLVRLDRVESRRGDSTSQNTRKRGCVEQRKLPPNERVIEKSTYSTVTPRFSSWSPMCANAGSVM